MDSQGCCYYTAGGVWAHDAWEFLGGYERKPDPGYYQGTISSGIDVYIAKDVNYIITVSNHQRVVDKRDKNTYNGKADPNFQIIDSYKITDRADQVEILDIITAYSINNPSKHKWERTQQSLLTEWIAHNHLNAVKNHYRLKHVDLNNRHEDVSYIGFFVIAVYEQIKELVGN